MDLPLRALRAALSIPLADPRRKRRPKLCHPEAKPRDLQFHSTRNQRRRKHFLASLENDK
jgi:hypothetical protein